MKKFLVQNVMINSTKGRSVMQHDDDPTDADSRSAAPPTDKRSRANVIATVANGWAAYSRLETDAVAETGPAALPPPQVSVSKPLVRELPHGNARDLAEGG
jgi:hypothetical protein